MSPKLLLLTAAVAACAAAPRTARASDFYARLLAGPAFFHNDNVSQRYDTSGFGVASQVDLGARLAPSVALHASLIYDSSRWMSFDRDLFIDNGGFETSVLGLGVGATGTWKHLSLGAVLGAQLTTHPGANDAPEGPEAAGLGPLFSATAGRVFPRVFEGTDLGVHALARYRYGTDEQDPSGFQLGLGLSITFAEDSTTPQSFEREEPEPAPPPERLGDLKRRHGRAN